MSNDNSRGGSCVVYMAGKTIPLLGLGRRLSTRNHSSPIGHQSSVQGAQIQCPGLLALKQKQELK